MKKDERLDTNIKFAKSLGYTVFWYGIFAVLLYRWFFLDQSFTETLDFFIIWFIASLVQFLMLAFKGTPMSYPTLSSKKDQIYSMVVIPFAAGLLSLLILYVFRDVSEVRRLLGGFLLSSFGTFALLTIYKLIVYLWEKKNF